MERGPVSFREGAGPRPVCQWEPAATCRDGCGAGFAGGTPNAQHSHRRTWGALLCTLEPGGGFCCRDAPAPEGRSEGVAPSSPRPVPHEAPLSPITRRRTSQPHGPSRCAIRLIRHAARHSRGPSRKRCEPSNPEICLQRNAAEGSRGRWRSPVRGPRSRPPRLCSPPAAHGEAGLHSRPRQYLNPGERVTPRSCNQ